MLALVLDGLASSSANITRLLDLLYESGSELVDFELHTATAACFALHDVVLRSRTRATALGAQRLIADLHGELLAEVEVLQSDGKFHGDIGSTLVLTVLLLMMTMTTEATKAELREDVEGIMETTTTLSLKAVFSLGIVDAFLFLVGQHFVSVCDFNELFLCFRIIVLIWVILQGKFSVGSLDVFLRGVSLDPQDVVVALTGFDYATETQQKQNRHGQSHRLGEPHLL